jgi:SAM-dependent methyltransferase
MIETLTTELRSLLNGPSKLHRYESALKRKLGRNRPPVGDPVAPEPETSPVPETALVSGRLFKADASLPVPSEALRASVGPAAAFHEVALTTIGRMSMAGIKADHDVLDIGCGVGRTARFLCDMLSPDARYEGFDIVEDGIRWCQENITPAYTNFRFQWTPLSNTLYSPDPSLPLAIEFEFPYPDESFDFAFAHSVFTHLLPDVTQHYLEEVNRVLRPGGVLYGTWFLFDVGPTRLAHPLVAEMHADLSGMFAVLQPDIPEGAVGYSEPFVRSLLEKAGLTINEPVHLGMALLQDVIVARK